MRAEEGVGVFFQADGGVRVFCLSRGLGDVCKLQLQAYTSRNLLLQAPTSRNLILQAYTSRNLIPVSYTHMTLPTIFSV